MNPLQQQCHNFLSLVLRDDSSEDDTVRERGGGGQPTLTSGAALTVTQQTLISKLLSHRARPQQAELLERLFPRTLPDSLKEDVNKLDYPMLSAQFKIEEALQHVSEGRVSALEVITGYLKSIKNIYDYELSDQGGLHNRLLQYFSRMFSEICEPLYPRLNEGTLEQILLDEVD